MPKCSACKKDAELPKGGLCSECYDTAKKELESIRDGLSALHEKSLYASPEDAPAILEQLRILQNRITALATSGVPIDKKKYEAQFATIHQNVGVPYKRGLSEKTKRIVTYTFLGIFVILTMVATYKYRVAQRDLETAVDLLVVQDEYIASLKKEVADLKLGENGNKKAYVFENGNYVAGVDFSPGTYDIIALDGMGNVYTDDFSLTSGINAMMGVPQEGVPDNFFQEKYSNIELNDGVTLTVHDLKIRLVKSK